MHGGHWAGKPGVVATVHAGTVLWIWGRRTNRNDDWRIIKWHSSIPSLSVLSLSLFSAVPYGPYLSVNSGLKCCVFVLDSMISNFVPCFPSLKELGSGREA